MRLQRLYKDGTVTGVKVLRAGDKQHFSESFIAGAESEGWLEFDGQCVVISGEDGVLVYRVIRKPGYYCCECEEQLDSRSDALDHLESDHNNQGRYEVINYFDCVRED